MFELTGGPFWLTLEDSSRLVIDAPNKVSVVGQYSFYLSIWKVTLTVEAPCDSTYLQGLKEAGHVNVQLDESVTLLVQF